jgi:hypothetical protein
MHMSADGHGDKMPSCNQPLTHRAVMVLAASFEVRPREVDARTVSAWQEPADDLVVWLCRQHSWRAEMAVNFLGALLHLRG